MKKLLSLLVFTVLQTTLPAQNAPVRKDTLTGLELVMQQKKNAKSHSFYLTTPVLLDESNNYEPFLGIGLNYDFRIYSYYIPWAQMGISTSVGHILGSNSRYNSGPFFKIGPKLFLGSSRKCATVELQYFQFREHNAITYHGVAMGAGLALTGKNGFFFHPKIAYQYSSSKEKTKYPDPSLRNLVIEFGLGYSF